MSASHDADGPVTPGAALAVWCATVLAIAAVAGRRPKAGVALAAANLAAPLLVTGGLRITRFLLAAAAVFCVLRALDFVRDGAPAGFRRRAAHLVVVFDSRRARQRPPGVERGAWLGLLVGAVLFTAAFHAAVAAMTLRGPVHYALQWLAAAVMAFAGIEASASAVVAGAALAGVEAPAMHDHPYLARSLAEFWGRRWNRAVSRLLDDHLFSPVERWSRPAALFAAFGASAALHAYAAGASVGAWAALAWGAFFLVQPALILIERRLRVGRWPPVAGRAWTIAALALTSPLFLDPLLHLFLQDPHP